MSEMTDRELLELAAKAAGLDGMKYLGKGQGLGKMIDPTRPAFTGTYGLSWNPLTDDGDALRLAVDLQMKVEVNKGETNWHAWACPYGAEKGESIVAFNRHDATRRAIVRAAAAIGAKS